MGKFLWDAHGKSSTVDVKWSSPIKQTNSEAKSNLLLLSWKIKII